MKDKIFLCQKKLNYEKIIFDNNNLSYKYYESSLKEKIWIDSQSKISNNPINFHDETNISLDKINEIISNFDKSLSLLCIFTIHTSFLCCYNEEDF